MFNITTNDEQVKLIINKMGIYTVIIKLEGAVKSFADQTCCIELFKYHANDKISRESVEGLRLKDLKDKLCNDEELDTKILRPLRLTVSRSAIERQSFVDLICSAVCIHWFIKRNSDSE